jgi:hypothetical protein
MTEPSQQPGDEIRRGDKVRWRDTSKDEDQGDVAEVLPFYGGFQGGPDRVLLTVAVVTWKTGGRRTVVRVDDLIKVT